jgi:hypothetical protein
MSLHPVSQQGASRAPALVGEARLEDNERGLV